MDWAAAVREFVADAPRVHRPGYRTDFDDTAGRWSFDSPEYQTYITSVSCYELIARHVGAGSVTMETGLGLSTIVFAALGCEHTTMFLDPGEEAPLRAWATEREIDLSGVDFVVGPSDVSLREMGDAPIDLFFIDGGHGYPLPQLDWFYGASRLREGGVLVLDDLQLWAPRQLDRFLGLDPRWERLAGDRKWSAFRRRSSGPVAEDFDTQPFLPERRPAVLQRARAIISRLLPERVKARIRRSAR